MNTSRFSFLIVCLTCLITNAIAHAPAHASDAGDPGGELIRALQVEPDSLDPAKAVASETGRIIANIYEGPLSADAAGRLEPRLATDWHVSAGGRTYAFWLRRGVTFHDGSRFSSADVKYTFERLRNPETGFSGIANWESVTDVEVDGEFIVKIHLAKPYAPFLAFLASPGVAIIPEDAGEELHNNPVGTGPFRFVEWVRERHVTLQRFDGYWEKGLPYLDRVVLRVIPDPAVRLAALMSGDADVVDIDAVQADRVDASPITKVVSGSLNMVQLFALNHERAPWDDPRVRQAVAHAVNRQQLIDAAAWGFADPLYSALTTVNGYFQPRANPFPRDLNRAKELLSEAGYPDGFTTTVTVPSIYQFHIDTAQALREQLRLIGIQLDVQLIDWAGWLERVWAGEGYDTTIIGFTGKLDPHHELQRYTSEYTRNFINFDDTTYDTLIKKAIRTSDHDDRLQLYAQAQSILAEEPAAIFIMAPKTTLGVRADVEGWQIYPHYIDDLRRVRRAPQE